MNRQESNYYDKKNLVGSRTARNAELYNEISKTELSGYELKSNEAVIGNNSPSIDVAKIKSILDTHYNDSPKRKPLNFEITKEQKTQVKEHETKEYDINVILNKAREGKEENYNEDRAKKLRDTQFDILSNLDLEENQEIRPKAPSKVASNEEELQKLINTIALNESDVQKELNKEKVKEQKMAGNKENNSDPLDIFEDLKGTDSTAVLEGLQEKTENLIKKIEATTSHDTSFFTKTNSFKEKDFEDFEDLEEEGASKVVVRIIISILFLIFAAGIVILVKTLM